MISPNRKSRHSPDAVSFGFSKGTRLHPIATPSRRSASTYLSPIWQFRRSPRLSSSKLQSPNTSRPSSATSLEAWLRLFTKRFDHQGELKTKVHVRRSGSVSRALRATRRQRLSHALYLESLLASWDCAKHRTLSKFLRSRSGRTFRRRCASVLVPNWPPTSSHRPSRSRPRKGYHGKAGSEANDPTNAAHHDRSPTVAQAQHTASQGLCTAHALFARNGWTRAVPILS